MLNFISIFLVSKPAILLEKVTKTLYQKKAITASCSSPCLRKIASTVSSPDSSSNTCRPQWTAYNCRHRILCKLENILVDSSELHYSLRHQILCKL